MFESESEFTLGEHTQTIRQVKKFLEGRLRYSIEQDNRPPSVISLLRREITALDAVLDNSSLLKVSVANPDDVLYGRHIYRDPDNTGLFILLTDDDEVEISASDLKTVQVVWWND